MSFWTQTNLPLRKRSLGLWIGISSVALFVAGGLLIPRIQAAREAARNIQSNSTLFQHSGWHPCAVVKIHQNGSVTGGCCPMCFTPAAPIVYLDSNGDALNAEELPDWVVEKGMKEIRRVQRTPEYQNRRRGGFAGGDETRADEWAKSMWDDYQVRRSP